MQMLEQLQASVNSRPLPLPPTQQQQRQKPVKNEAHAAEDTTAAAAAAAVAALTSSAAAAAMAAAAAVTKADAAAAVVSSGWSIQAPSSFVWRQTSSDQMAASGDDYLLPNLAELLEDQAACDMQR
jgi:hypothetical protein